MIRTFAALLIATAWSHAHAQSSLPPCPNSPTEDIRVFGLWKNCFGQYKFAGDRTYKGDFLDMSSDGNGEITYPNGDRYIGEFRRFQRQGYGRLVSKYGYEIATGQWDDDRIEVSGGQWVLVGFSEDLYYFVLNQSIRSEGAFRRAWLMQAFRKPNQEYRWLSDRALMRFDCKDERRQRMTANSYSGSFGEGESLDSFGQGNWDYVHPGTVLAVVMAHVCDYKL